MPTSDTFDARKTATKSMPMENTLSDVSKLEAETRDENIENIEINHWG
jgi:hypothetical protein